MLIQPNQYRLLQATPPRLNLSHPLVRGMTSCFVPMFPGILVDLFKIRPHSTSGTPDPGKLGQSITGKWTLGVAADTADLNWTSGPFSAAAWANLPANQAGVYVDIFARYAYTNESINNGWLLQLRATDDSFAGVSFVIFNNNGGIGTPGYNFRSGAAYVAGDQMIIGLSDGSGSKSIWSNLTKTTSTNANFAPATSPGSLNVAANAGTAKLYIGCTWNRLLTDQEATMFYYAPFSMFSYREDILNAQVVSKSAGGGAAFQPAWAIGRNRIADGVAT